MLSTMTMVNEPGVLLAARWSVVAWSILPAKRFAARRRTLRAS
jgi:hypothetical protein